MGYIGYSMSERAALAYSDGEKPLKKMETLTSRSQLLASKKYDMKHDKICVRLPQGTADKIKALGYTSLNKFAVSAIENEIKKQRKTLELFPELNYDESGKEAAVDVEELH